MNIKLKSFSPFLLWTALAAVLLVLIFVFRAGILAICLYAFLILLALAGSMTRFWLKPIRCERELSQDVANAGDRVKVITRLTNTAPWPILWLYAEESLPADMSVQGTTKRLLFLLPKRSFFLIYSLMADRRGCHQIGPVVLETGDVFGLFKKFRVDKRRDFVTVLPNYNVIEEFQVGGHRRLGEMGAERSIFEDPSRIRGIREYRRGDAMKRIHWKASARTGRLCTKIYDPVVESAATVVLDFHRDSWKEAIPTSDKPADEMAVEIACTICRYLSDGGWKVGFFSNGRDPLGVPGVTMAQARAAETLTGALEAARSVRSDDRLEPISIPARSSPDHFSVIHENLGRIELSDGLPIEALLMDELAHIERHQALVVIVSRVTDDFVSGILRIRELGYRVMVFVVCDHHSHEKAFETLLPHGVEVYRMDEEWRLREIATGRKFI